MISVRRTLCFLFLIAAATAAENADFIGARACGVCHAEQYAAQGRSEHAKSLVSAGGHPLAAEFAATGADLVCVLTAWDEFRYIDPAVLGELVAGRRIIDAMNCLDMPLWTAAGWEYRGMGRPR